MIELGFQKEHFSEQCDKKTQRVLFQNSVSHVIIELFTFCNRKCPYCPNALFDRSKTNIFMDETVFDKIISSLDEINYQNNICLNLYNEPLAEKEYILNKISYIRTRLPKVFIYFSSNGDYLTKEYLRDLERAGLNKLYVTVHPAGDEEYNDLEILSRFSTLSAKLDIPLKFTALVPGAYVGSKSKFHHLDLEVFSADYRKRGQNRGGLIALNTINGYVRSTPCDRPFNNLTVAYDGSVFPCCQFYADDVSHKQYTVANLNSDADIFTIYSSSALASWRSSLFRYGPKKAPCNSCTEGVSDVQISKVDIEKRDRLYEELTKRKNIFSLFK